MIKTLILLILISLNFIGCSKEAAEVTNAKVLVKNSFAINGNYPAGMMVYLNNLDTKKVRAVSVTTQSLDVKLENGNWKLTAIGWQGSSPFTGNLICGSTTVVMKGIDVTIDLAVNAINCNSDQYVQTSYRTAGTANFLRFITCKSLSGVTAAGSNCDGASKGITGSYKIHLLEYDQNVPLTVPATFNSIPSDCLTATGGSISINDTNLKIPVGGTGEKFSTLIEAFSDSTCTSGITNFLFSNGLISPNDANEAKIYANGSYSEIYALHSNANLILSSGAISFGTNVQGATAVSTTLTFTNAGGLNANLSAISGLSNYTLSANTCGSGIIIPNASCSVTVTLPTTTVGTFNETLTLNYNSSTKNFSLTGNIISQAALSISDGPTYDFGFVNVGNSPTKTFTITNSGAATASAINFTGASSPLILTGGTCTPTLAGGASCTKIVTYSPTTYGLHSISLSINYNNGVSAATPVVRPIQGHGVLVVTVNPFFATNGINWNDYVNLAAATAWSSASDTACNATSSTNCIHGGELKKVNIASFNSNTCTNLTYSDSLNALEWECVPGNPVVFRSTGLKKGKGLKDLVSASAWNTMNFSVYLSGDLVAQSSSTTWWTNSIINLTGAISSSSLGASLPLSGIGYAGKNNTNGTTGALVSFDLTTANAIYTINSNMTVASLHLGANKISLVTLGTAVLSTANASTSTCTASAGTISAGNDTPTLICGGAASGKDFTWLEVKAIGPNGGNGTGIFLFDSRFSRIHNTEIYNATRGIYFNSPTKKNRITNSYIHNNSANGIEFYTSSNQELVDVYSMNNGTNGLYINLGGSNSILRSNFSYNTQSGVNINGGSTNTLQGLISASNGVAGAGILLGGTTSGNFLSNLVIVQNQGTGLYLNSTTGNDISHVTIANNNASGLKLSGAIQNYITHLISINNNNATGIGVEVISSSTSNVFKHIVSAHNWKNVSYNSSASNTLDIVLTGSAANTDCSRVGGAVTMDGSSVPASGTCPGIISNLSIASAASNPFLGAVTSDTTNADNGILSTGVVPLVNITDFKNFQNPFRAWGKESASNIQLNSSTLGKCVAGNCTIWDWRLKSADAYFLNKVNDGTTTNGAFTAGSSCPSIVNGAVYYNDGSLNILTHAYEPINLMDGIGNDNGMCESNEACIYAPNFGAFHGEGALTGTCTFGGGIVSGVQLKAYSTLYGN